MRVLHVVDGVLVRLLLGQLDIEVDGGRRSTRREEPAGGVDADLAQQLVEGDELAGPLAHRDLLAVADEADPGVQQDLDGLAVVAHRLGGVADAGDRAVVVGAPDVDEVVEAAAELLGDVADVGGEIRRPPVGADDHPILVVTERRRAEPQRAVLLVHVAAFAQPLDRALDPALVVEPRLARPDIEVDTESLEAGLDAFADPACGPATDDVGRRRAIGRFIGSGAGCRRAAPAPGPRRSRRGSRPRGSPRPGGRPGPMRRGC